MTRGSNGGSGSSGCSGAQRGRSSYFGTFGPGGIIGGIGPFKHVLDHGGNNDLGIAGGLIASAGWALIIYYVAIWKRLPVEKVNEYIKDVYPPTAVTH